MNQPLAQRLGLPLLLLAAFAMSLGGCAEENSLSGSLSDFYDVSFDRVRTRLYPSELAIEYTRDNGEVPVRVTIDVVEGQALSTGTYKLPAAGDVTGRSGSADIPPLDSATVKLEEYAGGDNTPISGTFDASFLTGDDTTSLNGEFSSRLEVVETTDGYVIDGFPPGQDCDNAVELVRGQRFSSTLDANDSDAVAFGSSCGGGVDVIFTFTLEEAREVSIRPEFDDGIQAALHSGTCGDDSQLFGCFFGRAEQSVMLEPGVYFLAVEGEGAFALEVGW